MKAHCGKEAPVLLGISAWIRTSAALSWWEDEISWELPHAGVKPQPQDGILKEKETLLHGHAHLG